MFLKMLMEVIYNMIQQNSRVIRLTPLNTQVTHPFLYPTRMRNNKNKNKSFFKNYCLYFNTNKVLKNNKKNIFLFLFRNQTLTLGCVTCVWIMGVFLL